MNTMMSPSATIPEFEYGRYSYPGVIDRLTTYSFNVKFNKQHSTAPTTVLLSYRTYNYFWGSIHLDTIASPTTNEGFYGSYIAQNIGNGTGSLVVDWVAIW